MSGEDSLEEGMATHFSILAWSILWMVVNKKDLNAGTHCIHELTDSGKMSSFLILLYDLMEFKSKSQKVFFYTYRLTFENLCAIAKELLLLLSCFSRVRLCVTP